MALFNLSVFDWLCFGLLILGAINWGLVGLADINAVQQLLDPIFQPDAADFLARAIYVLIGIAGLYFFYPLARIVRLSRRQA